MAAAPVDLEQALSAALQLLTDIERQMRDALCLGPTESLPQDAERLQSVPQALLNSLESTVALVQELRDQLDLQPVAATQHTGEPQPGSRSAVTCRDKLPASPKQATTTTAAAASHRRPGGSCCRQLGSPPVNATCSGSSPRSSTAAAARTSSLPSAAASDRAVADWHQAKLQQQEEAAMSQQRQLAREQQLLRQLEVSAEAAITTHEQAVSQIKQLGSSISLLQLLSGTKQRWHQYLAAQAQTLPAHAFQQQQRVTSSRCRGSLWSRQPDDWDVQWEQEEQARRQQRQQLTLAQQAAQEAAWRQQVDQVHQQLLDQQKHKAALRQRLQQDAQRAKREQLRRVEPVAKARARASGLASLGLDPEIMGLSEKFGKLSGLVEEVQQRMEVQYGSMASWDDAAAYGQLPVPSAAPGAGPAGIAKMNPAAGQQQHALQPASQVGFQQQPQWGQQQQQQQWGQQPRQSLPMQRQAPAAWPVARPSIQQAAGQTYTAAGSVPQQQFSAAPQQPPQQPQPWQQPTLHQQQQLEQQQQWKRPQATAQPGAPLL